LSGEKSSEEKVLQLAEKYRDISKFVDVLENSGILANISSTEENRLLAVGKILLKHSYFDLALIIWNNALTIFIRKKDTRGQSICYTNLGLAYYELGDVRRAIEYYNKSLEIDREIGDKAGESIGYTNLGLAYHSRGDFKKAIEYHENSLEINIKIRDKAGESKCYGNLGLAYHSLGDFKRAIKCHNKSLEIDREIGDKAGQSKCYGNLGLAYHSLGDFKRAIEYHKNSLEIDREIGDKAGESKCYGNLGLAYHSLGDFKRAIKCHKNSLDINREIGDKAGESKCYGNLGLAYYSLGDFKKAVEYHNKSLDIAIKIGDKEVASIAYYNLAFIYYTESNYEKSLDYAENSLALTEQVRETLIREELGMSFLKTKIKTYDLAINSAIELYKTTKEGTPLKIALEIIERTKSRELIKRVNIEKKKGIELEEKYKELEEIEREIAALEARKKKMLKELTINLDPLYKKKSKLSNENYLKSLDPSSLTPHVDLNLFNLFWDRFNKYRDNCSVMEMYEQWNRVIYLLFDKEEIKFFEKEIDRGDLKDVLEKYLTISKDLAHRSTPVKEFYTILEHVVDYILPEGLKKELEHLKTDDLFIIPHRWLHWIAWEAADVNGTPLCIKYNLIRHYSLDLIRASLNYPEGGNNRALIVSNPTLDLPGAKEECREVKKNIPYETKFLDGKKVKLSKVKAIMPKTSLVHFACHAKFNPEEPFASKILLNDQALLASDIPMKHLEFYPLIFLNACESGRAETGGVDIEKTIRSVGDEQIGFLRAFFMAHAPTVIATSWEIGDEVAKEFAGYFYGALLRYFSWNKVPGNNREKLLRLLRDDLDLGWVRDAEIRKSNDGKTIRVFKNDENSVEIILDETKEKATLKVSDGITHDLKVKKEKGKLNVYSENNVVGALKIARKRTYEEFKEKERDWAAYVLYGNPYREYY
jgi:tetratricopeptide (TPR) repeat protein